MFTFGFHYLPVSVFICWSSVAGWIIWSSSKYVKALTPKLTIVSVEQNSSTHLVVRDRYGQIVTKFFCPKIYQGSYTHSSTHVLMVMDLWNLLHLAHMKIRLVLIRDMWKRELVRKIEKSSITGNILHLPSPNEKGKEICEIKLNMENNLNCSVDEWIKKICFLYIHNGIISSHKKEGIPAICHKHVLWRYYLEWNKSEKNKHCIISFI